MTPLTGDPLASRPSLSFDSLETRDGRRLCTAVVSPDGPARATVALLQGRTEFIQKYGEVMARLTAAGCRVATLDWRGQGLSERLLENPLKGHLEDYGDCIDDLGQFIDQVVKPVQEGPLVMLAHSMGGHIGLRYLYRDATSIDGAVFSAPMWDLPLDGVLRKGSELMAATLRRLGLGARYVPGRGDIEDALWQFDRNVLTRDRDRFERILAHMAADPRLRIAGPTISWLDASFDSIKALKKEIATRPLDLPLLVLSGGEDRVVDLRSHHEVCDRYARARCKVYPNGQHELLMEVDEIFDDAVAEFLTFVDGLVAPQK